MNTFKLGGRVTPRDIEDMKTLCVGQCCSLKVESPGSRIWLCRVSGGVTVEYYIPHTGRWETVAGDCNATDGAVMPESISEERGEA